MSHSGGIVQAPVDVRGDIAYILGRRSGDVGHLCGDTTDPMDGVTPDQGGKVTFWSLIKPIRHYKIGILSNEEFKEANYGYTINDYNRIVGEGQQGLLYGHINNESWLYLKPRGGEHNEPFRVLDFNGYDHGATNPFVVSYSPTPTLNESARIDLTFLDQLLTWGKFSAFGPTYANLYLGLVAYPSGSSTPLSCYLLPVTSSRSGLTILDIAGNERFTYPVPSNIFSSGTAYKLRPVIMTYDAGNNYGAWRTVSAQESSLGTFWDVLCPEILVTPASAPPSPSGEITVDGVDVDTDNAVFSGDDDIITIESVPITIHNTTPYQMTNCSLYVYFKDYQQANPTIRELGHTSSFSISANSSSTKTVTGNLSIRTMASGIANGYWTFIYTTNGTTHTIGGDSASDGGRFSLNINK